MHPFWAFLICLILITIGSVRYRLPAFLLLIGAALFYGFITGMTPERILTASTSGGGAVFATLGIVIYAGAVIAAVLQEGGFLSRIVHDLERFSSRPSYIAGIGGYLITVPMMCCVTAFIVLAPITSCMSGETRIRSRLLYLTAFGSVLAFVLIYPAPVMLGMVESITPDLGSPYRLDLLTIPLSLLILGLACAIQKLPSSTAPAMCPPQELPSFFRSWAPFLAILLLILLGLTLPPLHPLGNVNLALLGGVAVALAIISSGVRTTAIATGTKRAGVIIFDLCGAGAFGGVIAASTFPRLAFETLSGMLPIILLPFILAAIIQAAQGSRTVSALVTAQILSVTTLAQSIVPLSLLLMIAGGTCAVSYLSDPYFWLIQRTTGDSPGDVVRSYTIPLALAGCAILGVALLVQFLS